MEQHTLGQRIRRERQNLHLTQEQLAEKLNVSSAQTVDKVLGFSPGILLY